MTTASVKDVGSMMNSVVATAPVAKSGGNDFQSVWNTQTGKGKTPGQQDADRRAKGFSGSDRSAKPGEHLRKTDSRSMRADKTETTDETGEIAQSSEEEFEAAMETVATAVAGLIQQIADTFQVPVEDVQALMDGLELQPVDLLQPENLSSLLLEAGGVKDSTALITNEQLYQDYRMLMEQGATILEQAAETLQMTPEQVQQVTEAAVSETAVQMPIEMVDAVNRQDVEASQKDRKTEEPESLRSDTSIQTVEAEEDENAQTTEKGHNPENRSSHNRQGGGHEDFAHGNPVLQEIRNEQFQPQTEMVQQTEGPWDSNTRDMMRQIMDYMRIQVRPDVSNLEMQLHPASLGTLQIQVAAKGGVLTANFITQNESVKAVLESQMIQLRESFEEQGVRVEAIEVTVQTHQFEENLEQGRGRQPQEPGERRGRTRRINLNDLEDANGTEQLNEAEQLAAEMMAAGGNTVDYTA